MKVYHSLEEYERGHNTVATIGTFDGVHIGHKTILSRLKEAAAEIGGETVLISFHPHPRLVLFPENNPLRLLQTLDEKIQLLDDFGIDKLLLIPFTAEFSRTPSIAFIKDILAVQVGIKKIVIGYDHHFGKNRTGNIDELRRFAPDLGYDVEEIPAQAIDNANISSTKIRKAIQAGAMQTAHNYLGYTYNFSGEVIHGEKQGRKLGYPTANIQPHDKWKLIPGDGIYFVRCWLDKQMHYGMMSIGFKPTMGDFDRGIEINLFDFDRDIYGASMRVEPLDYIRGEKKFKTLDDLKTAMAADQQFCLDRIKEIS